MRCEYCGRIINEGEEYYEIGKKTLDIDHVLNYLDDFCERTDEDDGYIFDDGDVLLDDEVNIFLRQNAKTCMEQEEDGNPREEPEFWKER